MSDWPLILPFGETHSDQRLALATLVHRDGSSYRQPGARMLIAADGKHVGSLSGGCLEEGIAQVAQKVIRDGVPRIEAIDTRPHFGCPGTLTFLIEALDPHGKGGLLQQIKQHILDRKTFLLESTYCGNKKSTHFIKGPEKRESSDSLIEKVPPIPRLIAIGSTPDLLPLFEIARVLGWKCHQVIKDPSEASCPQTETNIVAPAEFAEQFPSDEATAVIIMSHHLTMDLSYLKQVLTERYAYVGLLGSRFRRESILNELGEAGLLENPEWIDRFFAPVGLDLGSHHPTTIALSIVAEIQAVFSGSSADSLRDRLGSIHTQPVCQT